jgi:D-alanine-D-alanine ligase
MNAALRHVVIAYETEEAAAARLVAHGFPDAIAAEIAVYLAQSTDLPAFMPEIGAALAAEGISVAFVELDDLPRALDRPGFDAAASLLWNLTDGIRYYRGSSVPALARLLGIPRYGSSPTAQHLCQDKFLSLAAAKGAGLCCPPTLLLEGEATIGALGTLPPGGPYFVKPNTLGAKIGIFADSRCATRDEARARSVRLWQRYRDRALVQPFVGGDDVRVSFLDTGGALREQLGIFRLARDSRSETGGAFMTMKDNETLSGARDTDGARGGFGASRSAAFVPSMQDLRADPAAAGAVAAIADAAERLARLAGLACVFSMDFRIDAAGQPVFMEFEVCPAVTIYDFQAYLRGVHGLSLGQALAKSFGLAHARESGVGGA